jgi:hypothetical protein
VYTPGILAATAGLEAGDLVAVTAAIETRAGAGGAPRFDVTRGTVLQPGAGEGGGGGGGCGRLCVGVGRMCMGRAEIFKARAGVGVEMVARVYDVASVPGVRLWGQGRGRLGA